jgi:lipopolysaccharide transport system permease protein
MTTLTSELGERGASAAPLTVDLSGSATGPGTLWRAVWARRDLLAILARKEFHVRYRRATFGVLWAVALPVLQSLVLAVVFSRVAHIGHASHYPVFVLSGMAAWLYFAMAFATGSTAIVDGSDLSSRVYFPRIMLPLVQLGSNLYGLAITVVVLVVMSPVLGVGLGARLVYLMPGVVLLVLVTAGFALVASALHVYFRDIRYLVSAALMMWMYVTPVIYPPADTHGLLRSAVLANPLTGVVELFHAATVGATVALLPAVLISLAWTAALLVAGVTLHCRFDRVFGDLL